MGKLYAHTVKISTLQAFEVDCMYHLFATYYENTQKEKFLKDLLNKDKVILLRDKYEKKIRGFSTIKFMDINIQGKKVYGLFSGDTVIDADYWGQTALTMEFFKVQMFFKFKHPFNGFYWFLISKGFKTYLLLTNNYQNYFPRFDKETPRKHKMIIDGLAHQIFGETYDSNSGLLKCANLYERLKGEVAPIDDHALKNPNIKYFQDKNPNWIEGEELCCIGRVDYGLVTKYLSRTYKKRLKPVFKLSWFKSSSY